MIQGLINRASKRARRKRAKVFLENFQLDEETKILDFGSETGRAINAILVGTNIRPENIYIADINEAVVMEGHRLYGFTPVVIEQSGSLPYPDQFFDIVYSSSVIEHVTIPKDELWGVSSSRSFREASLLHQHEFANEIRRLGKYYYVQTPNKYFPIESHTWLPFAGYLSREFLLPFLRFSNRIWVKKTQPDWHLLTERDMKALFPEATIIKERFVGLTKSVMAISK
ncbi:MAG: methyltransferase domain-containing protein [Candidimonas sp.]|nr:methyltransferase domain-containing protein [Candidimonas sp.]